MKPSLICGIFFGMLTLLINIFLIVPYPNKMSGLILISGLLFFNSLFSVLFTKKSNGYQLAVTEGMKAAIQSGIIMSLFYCLSIYLVQNHIKPGYFPDLVSMHQYFINFNFYIIGFSILSVIFGVITSGLFQTKN